MCVCVCVCVCFKNKFFNGFEIITLSQSSGDNELFSHVNIILTCCKHYPILYIYIYIVTSDIIRTPVQF